MITADDARGRILLSGFEDWVSLAESAYLVRITLPEGTDAAAVRHETLRLVAELAGEGLIEVGDLTPLFHPWDATTDDAVRRIEQGWPDPERRLRPGDVCWLANTALGNAFAEELLQQRARFPEETP